MKRPKAVAIIPAFNEEKRVEDVVRRTKRYVDDVLVVDDGSKDLTSDVAKRAGAKVLIIPTNMGVGFGTRVGAEYAIDEMNAEILVFIDADGQHPPEAIPVLLEKILEGYDGVFATRSLQLNKMPILKRFGNAFLSFVTNIFSGGHFTDTQTGFRAFTAKGWKRLRLGSDGYEICSEIAWETAKRRIKYCEIPIHAAYDAWTEIKGTDVVTGIKIFLMLVWWRLTRWN